MNGNEPFGMVTSGKDAYVTIAHLNQVALVRKDAIVNSGFTTQSAPCWATLAGAFLFTSNTASQNLQGSLSTDVTSCWTPPLPARRTSPGM